MTFIVRNVTDRAISIPELRASIDPGQILDLRDVARPEDIIRSPKLQKFVREGKLKFTEEKETKK